MKRIVFGSANHWTSPYQVGSHAWARLFAADGWKAAYISDPITPWHKLSRKNQERNRERFALWLSMGKQFENGKVTAWTPFSLIAPYPLPFFASRWVMEAWDSLTIPSLNSQIHSWGFDCPEILWLDSVRHGGWGKRLKPHLTILRIADWMPGFSNVLKSALEMERRLMLEADLVITSSKTLEERIRSLRGKRPLCTIRNGVDVSFWSQLDVPPPEYAQIPPPRAIYVGALDEWFDISLLSKVAKNLSQLSFVLIGQQRPDFVQELSLPNVYWLGSRSREETRRFLHYAQVGIIPFKRSELIECVCPLKLYEYMACGLPVVSTYWEELGKINSPARLAKDATEWTDCLQSILTKARSTELSLTPTLYPRNSWDHEIKSYILANDWKQRWLEWQKAYHALAI